MDDIWTKAHKQYKNYKLKSFFGIKTRGLNNDNSLILTIILERNEVDGHSFVIVNNIDSHEQEYINDMHKKALRTDENNYVSIFFDTSNSWGTFVPGLNIKNKLSDNFIKSADTKFKKLVSDNQYFRATETLIKDINEQIAK